MSVPALRFKEFNSSWEVAKLGDLLGEKISNGEMIGKSDFVQDSGNFYLIQLNDLYESNIQLLVNKLQMVKFNEKAKSVEVGDTLINRVSIKPEGVGKVTVITVLPSNLRTIFESNMFRVRFASEKVYQLFFAYFSLTKSYEKQKLALSKTTNQSSLSQSDISFIEISYPKIPEQTKIANFLTAVDEKITHLTQKYDLLTQYKKGVMQKIFSQELRFKDDDGREFPEWTKDNLLNLSASGFTNGVFNDPAKVGSGYKLINVLDMYIDTTIDENNLSLVELSEAEFKKNKVKCGDTFFTRSSLVKSGIAYSNVYMGTSDDVTFDGHLIKMSPKLDKVDPLFLNYVLRTEAVRKQLITRGKTATMTTIGQADIAEVNIDIPSLKEQTIIANFLTSIDDKITQTQEELAAVKQYKQGLLQQMFV